MSKEFRSEVSILPGTFGNREVRLSRLYPVQPNGVHALMLHGVHSSANLSPRNKFSYLAHILAEHGITPWLCETSRRAVNRENYAGNLRAWIKDAFGGKTFPDELADCETALSMVRSQKPDSLWLWGFSLGGITALDIAASHAVDRIILSGTGLVAVPDAEREMIPLPILSTLRANIPADMLERIKARDVILFRGTRDEIFSEAACMEMLSSIKLPEENKKYFPIEGADHSLKMRFGRHDQTVMDEMLELLLSV